MMTVTQANKKIAIIGAGISGLSCAYMLNKKHDITVYESAQAIGGHTATKTVEVASGRYHIDTGFIVYNDRTYPHFIKLLKQLAVRGQKTDMGFSVNSPNTHFEYAGTSLKGFFAQAKNIINIKHWKMLIDILRFNRKCIRLHHAGTIDPELSLADYLREQNFSEAFKHYYLLPMVSAIWSSGTTLASAMPLSFFIQFFYHHGLLSITRHPQWYTVMGGSNTYLAPLTQEFKEKIKTGVSIARVERCGQGVYLYIDGEKYHYDEVVFACHSDQALALLGDRTKTEEKVLKAITYQPNNVVLHTDESILPNNKAAWASWNYQVVEPRDNKTLLTYNMNILQSIKAPETFCVSVNADDKIDQSKILGRYQYHHPVFTRDSIKAQQCWQDISGHNHTHYCGAYWYNGFHEDGVVSALRVAKTFGCTL